MRVLSPLFLWTPLWHIDMEHYVTLNRQALKNIVRQAVWDAISSKIGAVSHTNHDAINAPSSWWYDREYTQRHTMTTSGSMSFSQGTITINLNYEVG